VYAAAESSTYPMETFNFGGENKGKEASYKSINEVRMGKIRTWAFAKRFNR